MSVSRELADLSHAVEVVVWAWVLIRYARGWRLKWRRPPATKSHCGECDATRLLHTRFGTIPCPNCNPAEEAS